MILYIQPIFVPDEERFKQNKNSLVSFGRYLKKYPYDVKCIFGGWTSNDEWWGKICKVIKNNIPSDMVLEPIRFDRNYGKAYVINKLYEKTKALDFDFFLSADSDILFTTSTNNLFERLLDIGIKSPHVIKKSFGFIAPQQEINCRHKLGWPTNQYYIENRFNKKELISFSYNPSGIAGGCLFINRKFWEKIGGYKVMGVYAGDDACLIEDAHLAGYSYQISPNISIIHPFETDEDYVDWKYKVLHNGSFNDKRNRSSPELNKDIQMHDEYWNEKNL